MGLLDDIAARKRVAIAALRATSARATGVRNAVDSPVERLRRRKGEPLRLIGEIKHRSPSAGLLSTALSPVDRARIYESCGVSAISVLTDEDFFGGSFADLANVSKSVSVPLLCKDFVLDDVQLDAARAAGASMVLLIVRLLDSASLKRLMSAAHERSLTPFVEVANEQELHLALESRAEIIGVNARDLDTLAMDAARTTRVLDAIPKGVVAVHLSGIRAPNDIASISPRADAALLGEALMRQDDPTALLTTLITAAGGPWRAS